MRKRLSLLYALIVLAIGAHAYSFESGGIYYNITSSTNMTVEVTYGKNYGAYVDNIYTIPNQVTYNAKTYYVTAIGSHAFTSCTALGTVDLSQAKHLSSIGEYAFSGCNGMSRITIPEHVTTIGNYAFSGCMTLSILEIEDSKNTLSLGYGSSKGSNYGLFADCNLYTRLSCPAQSSRSAVMPSTASGGSPRSLSLSRSLPSATTPSLTALD